MMDKQNEKNLTLNETTQENRKDEMLNEDELQQVTGGGVRGKVAKVTGCNYATYCGAKNKCSHCPY